MLLVFPDNYENAWDDLDIVSEQSYWQNFKKKKILLAEFNMKL